MTTWDDLVAIEPRLQRALEEATRYESGWHAYEFFKSLIISRRLVGWGSSTEAVATAESYDIALNHAADLFTSRRDRAVSA